LPAKKPADKSAGFVTERSYCFYQQRATSILNVQLLCNTLSFIGLASFFSNKLRGLSIKEKRNCSGCQVHG